MQLTQRWNERESKSTFNTGVAATASEQIITGTDSVPDYNFLFVQNRDAVPVELRLDGMTTNGRVFQVQANGGLLVLDPANGDDVHFITLTVVNLDAATAEVANKILFRWSRKERV